MDNIITKERIDAYCLSLLADERSAGTIQKYRRDLAAFARWIGGAEITKEAAVHWRSHLLERGCKPETVNSKLSAINGFFAYMNWAIRVKFLKIQRQIFRDSAKEMTKAGRATITLKGKIRTILLPGKLCRKLLQYAQKQKTASGAIFRTKSGKELGRRQIWAEMKRLCGHAGVDPRKVFPHNLRHLFAMVFYRTSRDIVKLADLLGHSSIETTRIYLTRSSREQKLLLDEMVTW